MIIKMGSQELAVLEKVRDVMPEGVNRLTNRNPAYEATLLRYGKLIEDQIKYNSMGINEPEVTAYFTIKSATSQGFIVQFIR